MSTSILLNVTSWVEPATMLLCSHVDWANTKVPLLQPQRLKKRKISFNSLLLDLLFCHGTFFSHCPLLPSPQNHKKTCLRCERIEVLKSHIGMVNLIDSGGSSSLPGTWHLESNVQHNCTLHRP